MSSGSVVGCIPPSRFGRCQAPLLSRIGGTATSYHLYILYKARERLTSLGRNSRLQAIAQVTLYTLQKKIKSLFRQSVAMLLNAETGMHSHSSPTSIHPIPRPTNTSKCLNYTKIHPKTSPLHLKGPPSSLLNMARPALPRMDARRGKFSNPPPKI